MSNVNATINKTEEITIIMDVTIKELVKKKGKPLLFALFYFVHCSFEKMYNE